MMVRSSKPRIEILQSRSCEVSLQSSEVTLVCTPTLITYRVRVSFTRKSTAYTKVNMLAVADCEVDAMLMSQEPTTPLTR